MTITIYNDSYDGKVSISVRSADIETQTAALFSSQFVSRVHTLRSSQTLPVPNPAAFAPLTPLIKVLYKLDQSSIANTGILPPGLLYLDDQYIIFEKPPAYQNLTMIPRMLDDANYYSDNTIMYRLPIPWQVYIVQYSDVADVGLYCSNVRMLFTEGPIQSFADPVYLPPLSNFYTNGDLCRPMFATMDELERYPKTIGGMIQTAYDWIWNSGTNMDLTNAIVHMYTQFKASDYENTVLASANHGASLYQALNTYSYHCSFPIISHLYELWEQVDLDQIVSMQWPNPSSTKNFVEELNDATTNCLGSWLRDNGIVTSDNLHYDDDEDGGYQCGDSDCHCMADGEYDRNAFFADINVWPIQPKTLADSVNQFTQTYHNPMSRSNPWSINAAMYLRNVQQQIVDLISYSS